jgi:hypothetical protein
MKEYPHTQPNQSHGTMMNQKTNEDYNKEKPDPKDPNQVQEHPNVEVPDVGNNVEVPVIPPIPPEIREPKMSEYAAIIEEPVIPPIPPEFIEPVIKPPHNLLI